jgi:hypothetical protein
MKYIKFSRSGIVTFGEHITHAEMAQRFPNEEVISAGFARYSGEDDCIGLDGESVSLQKKSKEGDTGEFLRAFSIYY